jgi:beta-lactamase superfamily II metal-dependent hydrolase
MAQRTSAAIRVRMYDVGFGDAFLLLFPDGELRPRRVLVDCGSVAKNQLPMADIVTKIINDVRDGDGVARIDVVIASHRHRDHVSGFASPLWSGIEVGEVWMPWTEHPTDAKAKKIRDKQIGLALALQQSLRLRFGIDPVVEGETFAERENAPLHAPMILNAVPNEPAMRTLHRGFAGMPKRVFLPDERNTRTYATPVLPGVSIHVLGPSRDVEVIRDIDPPAGESYVRAAAPTAATAPATQPFGRKWQLDGAELQAEAGWQHLLLDPSAESELRDILEDPEPALAATLDKAINGSSLMLVFEIGEVCLLFPGDAQWGTWMQVLADAEWRELLTRTNLLKVGHHGSHNATPPEFVEKLLPSGASALISTRPIRQWPDIPRAPLVEALRGQNQTRNVVRSDLAGAAPYYESVIPLASKESKPRRQTLRADCQTR